MEGPPVCLQPPPADVGLQLQATGTQGPMHRAEASKSIGQNAVVSESDEECTFVATPCRRARVTPTSGRTPPVGDASAEIVQIERERLVVEKERLGVEKERLGVEKERLHIDKCRLGVDKMKCDIIEQLLSVEKRKLVSGHYPPRGNDATQRHDDTANTMLA